MSFCLTIRLKEELSDFVIIIPSNLALQNTNENESDSPLFTDRNSIAILTYSCSKTRYKLDFNLNEDNNYKCTCLIDKHEILSVYGTSKQNSKRQAALKTLEFLENIFPTVKENQIVHTKIQTSSNNEQELMETSQDYIQVNKRDLINGIYPQFNEDLTRLTSKVGDKFEKMLKNWGWKGEGFGLGKEEQGIIEPIILQTNDTRLGLGSELIPKYIEDEEEEENFRVDKKTIKTLIISNLKTLLQLYLNSNCKKELIFESKFTNEERSLMHREAHKLALKTQSYGNDNERYLTIKKYESSADIVDGLNGKLELSTKYQILKK